MHHPPTHSRFWLAAAVLLVAVPSKSRFDRRCAWFRQKVELKATKIRYVGPVDAAAYPLAKKKTSMEFLREKVRPSATPATPHPPCRAAA